MPVCVAKVRAHFHGPLREKLMGMATFGWVPIVADVHHAALRSLGLRVRAL
jgi:hypothetical protein